MAGLKPFKTPKRAIGELDADTAAQLVTVATDIAVIIDNKGVVRDYSFSGGLDTSYAANWVGRPWIDTVTTESRAKVEELLRDAAPQTASRWRQVNHPKTGSPDLPVRYAVVGLNDDGRVLAMGRELSATSSLQQRLIETQINFEREFGRLRGAETRYRALFQLSTEAVLILDAPSMRIADANPAAQHMLAHTNGRIVGRYFSELFHDVSSEAVQALLTNVRNTAQIDDIRVRFAHRDRAVKLSAALFRQDSSAHVLVRMTIEGEGADSGQPVMAARQRVLDVVSQLPEAFVVIDPDRRVLTANMAFIELTQLATQEQIRGERIERWLGRTGVEVDVLIANLREHGSVRGFSMAARGEYGASEDVEIAAVWVPNGETPCFGLSMRKIARPEIRSSRTEMPVQRTMEQMTGLVGRVPLKDLVRESTDIIERMCIEAALELTGDNRASAAEMLGLSRQSLYVKLRRHGLGSAEGDQAE
jgi:transcriptional regulator PpsR